MPVGRFLLAVLGLWPFVWADTSATREAPSYSGSSVVNAADNQPGPLAPNTIATIYGTGLAYTTRALTAGDVRGGVIPTVLPGTGLRVFVGGIGAGIYYVSPTQINFLVPNILLPGPTDVQIALDAIAGPSIPVQIVAGAPALFQLDPQTVIAARPDGSVLTAGNPGKPGDYVIFYATGLGQVNPPLSDREIPSGAAKIKLLSDLKITLNGTALDARNIAYAGVSPGFGGLYQINVKLPDTLGANPEVRVAIGSQNSRAGVTMPIAP